MSCLGQSTQPLTYSQHLDQPRRSALIGIHCKELFLTNAESSMGINTGIKMAV